ncbi:38444_t:CDS:2 [Gigaspora margarita]|uniref:38444_t:CDS:1 n=1 Tax=Gigaspora margarita TaxID=4874 RepID=A0ABN7UWX7_GIGMA|nr:38444_t:CDS:2 [Gigaspora margarita]
MDVIQYFLNRFSSQEKTGNVHLINDESLGITKDIYKGKKARASLISAVERLVSKEDVVIAINCGTPPIEIAREWNSNRGEEAYEATIFIWDPVPSYDGILDVIIVKKAKPPNLSTVAL